MNSSSLIKSLPSRSAGTCLVEGRAVSLQRAAPPAYVCLPSYLRILKHFFVTTTAICAALVLTRPALAQSPTGGNVVAGSAGISQLGNITNINQSSQRAIINWQGFSVGAQNTVNFYQPGASSVTLNRVIGNETSVINGAINANGQVFIVNSAGVLFGKGSQINVGGLVASTLDIANNDFMAGNYRFSGNSAASVINRGSIRANGGGYVALMGKAVSNEGMIAAKLGTVAMASGEKITLNFGGDSLVDVTIDKGTLNALVQNKRAIIADGGQVIMTAKAADQVLSAQVNNSGIIQARSMAALKGGSSSRGAVKLGKIQLLAEGGNVANTGKLNASAKGNADAGSIKILASGGTANVSGTLAATAVDGNGGFIETSGDHVKVADGTIITTKSTYGKNGNWLIDPNGFLIASSGGDITGAALSAQLANGDVTISSTQGQGNGTGYGDLNVNDAVTWSSGNTLTLNAMNNINVNAPITWTTGTLALYANNQNINIGASLSGPTVVLDAGADVNLNAPDAFNVATVIGGNYNGGIWGNFNVNASQNWTTPPDLSGLYVRDSVNIYADLKWSSGTLQLTPDFGDINIGSADNPHGSLTGPSLMLDAGGNFNLYAPNALNVATVMGGYYYGGINGNFNIYQRQTWTTPPDLSALAIVGDINIDGDLKWSSGTLTLATQGSFSRVTNINIGSIAVPLGSLTGPSLVLDTEGDFNIYAPNALNVGTIVGGNYYGGIYGNFNIYQPQHWTTPPDMSGLPVFGDTYVNAALTWTGALMFPTTNVSINAAQNWSTSETLSVLGNLNLNAPVSWSTGTLTLNAGQNIFVNAVMTASGTANFAASDSTPSGFSLSVDSVGNYTGRIDFSSIGTVTLNGQAYTVINSIAGFDAIGTNLSGSYVLGKDVAGLSLADLSEFGFSSGGQFTGNFNGLGHALTTAVQPSITLPSSIGNLGFTNLILNSAGGISVNSSVTSGAGILTLNGTALTIAPSAVVSGTNIAVNAPVSWTTDDALTFTAQDNLFINATIMASGNNAALTLNANTGSIYINNAITLTGANAKLTMNYGVDYVIRTPASYSGTAMDANGNLVAQVDPHDPANGGDGIYGSITFTNSANTYSSNPNGLVINGQAYHLIHSIAELDASDLRDSRTGKYYNSATGQYDLDVIQVSGTLPGRVSWYLGSGTFRTYYDTATGRYTIPQLDPGGSGKYYNPLTKAYDLAALDTTAGDAAYFFYDPATGKYTVPSYDANAAKYYNPATGQYTLTSVYAYSAVYDPASNTYGFQSTTAATTYYYNGATGRFDLTTNPFAFVMTGNYALAGNIYATSDGTKDGTPIPYTQALATDLNGTFAGLGHTISDLTITNTDFNAQRLSLFGIVGQNQASVIRDIGMVDVNINSASSQVGGIAGLLYSNVSINNVYVTGSVAGNGQVGGIIGRASTNDTITNAFFSGTITSDGGGSELGGLVGYALGDNITIRNAHANVYIDIVTGTYVSDVGGLIGNFDSDGEVSGTYATGNIHIVIPNQYSDNVGGLIGSLRDGATLSNSFALVDIYIKPQYSEPTQGIGGLVGTVSGGVIIDNVYAKGDITIDVPSGNYGIWSVGGLVGRSDQGFPVAESYITNAKAYVNINAGGTSDSLEGLSGSMTVPRSPTARPTAMSLDLMVKP